MKCVAFIVSQLNRRRDELLFGLATWTRPVLGLIGGVVLIRCLDPIEVGILNTANLMPAYLAFLQFGIISGVNRNLPYFHGAGDLQKIERLLQAALGAANRTSLLGGLLCLAWAGITTLHNGPSRYAGALLGVAVLVWTTPMNLFTDNVLRGRQQFGALARTNLTQHAANFVGIILIPIFGFAGAACRPVIDGLGGWLLRRRVGVWAPVWRTDWGECRDLARVGFPIMLSGFMFGLVSVADRSIVAIFLGAQAVGQLSLATVIVNGLSVLPQSVGLLLFPRIASDYGANHSPVRLRRYVWLNLGLNGAMILPTCLLAWFAVGWAVPRFFPEYLPGLPAARIACLTSILWCYVGVGSVLAVLDRMRLYLFTMSLSLGLIWVLGVAAVKAGWGIEGAVWARALGTGLHGLLTVVYSLMATRARPPARRSETRT